MAISDAAFLADLERRRLRALVEVDLVVASELHAEDFQLITPGGACYSKDEYLGAVARGDVDYRRWEADEIDARVSGDAGCLRYRSTISIVVDGVESGPDRLWHTDYYERRGGRWSVVWSHATRTTR